MNKVRIYRHGSLTPASYKDDVEAFALQADSEKPAGRHGRRGSLYASPTLSGVTRWVVGILSAYGNRQPDVETYELTVDADSVYVYSVKAWEDYSWSYEKVTSLGYWKSGITLTEWLQQDSLNADDWEVLLTPENIISHKRVSKKRLLAHGSDRDSLSYYLDFYKIK